MKYLGANEIRERYLSFFESKDHLRLKSASLVPQNDKSLLLINSGMAPLKPYFTGLEVPPNKRVVTAQKCIRTIDIDDVGKDARHLSFFEMMGNFSFGDYFKEEAIKWSWEFLTKEMELDIDKLWATVYLDDDEAFGIWENVIGVPKEKIVRLGKDDNFWEVGVGPCGPCSEIYYDRGEKYSCGDPNCKPGCDCDRYMEIWNNVFTQYFREEDGSYSELDQKNIDTGLGLERMATVLQEVDSVFDIDTLKEIRDKVCEIAGTDYNADPKKDVSIRIIADHARSITFMTSDGIIPSNEGRGYILRRLLRRAARHGKILGINDLFLEEIVEVVIRNSSFEYSELEEKRDYILKVIKIEEERFYETLDQGLEILKSYMEELKGKDTLSGDKAFKLYDTYGFPFDLTKEILEENNLSVDEAAFKVEMNEQKERARSARAKSDFMGADDNIFNSLDKTIQTEFVGYDELEVSEEILEIAMDDKVINVLTAPQKGYIVSSKTPFYAEGGGQTGDKGYIDTETGRANVYDCKKVSGNKYVHYVEVHDGVLEVGQSAKFVVDKKLRGATAKNHTATHLLQKALKQVVGNHVEQSGSFVSEEKLRFDFTHFEGLTHDEISKAEDMVNEKIFEALVVSVAEMPIDEARAKGAMALFGEKYGDVVRVVEAGDYSIELCGGTHVNNTSEIGLFKILSETGVAAGVRRIEAVTGMEAVNYFKKQDEKVKELEDTLKTKEVISKVDSLMKELRITNKEVEILKSKLASSGIDEVVNSSENVEGINLIVFRSDEMDMNGLRDFGDKLKNKVENSFIVLASGINGKVSLVAMASDEAMSKGANAGGIIKEISAIVGGGGGGRPNMAQAGGSDITKIDEALNTVKSKLLLQLGK
ncbi:MAG: alanine--tRNA ligase [Clostridia bacterium]|jgi:alanyl-tRNA synthetase|nr:alanine--tRNA ligase [Clostridia bacterium]